MPTGAFTCAGCGREDQEYSVWNDLGKFCLDCEVIGLGVTKPPQKRTHRSVTNTELSTPLTPDAFRDVTGRYRKGAPAGPGRPRLYADDAERSRIYRERRKAKAGEPRRPGPKRKYRDNAARQLAYRGRVRARMLEEREKERAAREAYVEEVTPEEHERVRHHYEQVKKGPLDW